jgi:hypothetical protein
MIQAFLKAKHWQLFIIMIAPPIIFQYFMVANMLANFSTNPAPDPSFVFEYLKFFPLMMIITMGTLFGWIWSVVVGLQDKIPDALKFKTGRFKVFFFIPVIYIMLFSFLLSSLISSGPEMIKEDAPENFVKVAGFMMIIFPLHLFSMFCIFHSLYYAAKTFKTAELQRPTTFSDFAGEFFMIWFYIIGVWILQPKINNMVSENQNNQRVDV